MTRDPSLSLAHVVAALTLAEMALLADLRGRLDDPDDDALWNALSYVQDARSEVRGVLSARQPERPLHDAETERLSKRQVI